MSLLDYLLRCVYADRDHDVPAAVADFAKQAQGVLNQNPVALTAYDVAGLSLILADHARVSLADGPPVAAATAAAALNLYDYGGEGQNPLPQAPGAELFGDV